MFGVKFSKLPRHRKFSYQPLYYSEQKEELKHRVGNIKRESGKEEYTQESAEQNIRNAYSARKNTERFSSLPSNRFYGVKIFLIAIILGLVFYKVLNSDMIEIIFGHLNK